MTALAELKVPGPTTVALTAPFWSGVAAGRLLIQRCRGCGAAVFYPRALCPACWSDNLAWEEASGRGVLGSYSQVWRPGHPGWLPAAPYVVGLVRLREGPTMLSHILSGEAPPRVGDAVTMEPTDIGGRILPAFRVDRT